MTHLCNTLCALAEPAVVAGALDGLTSLLIQFPEVIESGLFRCCAAMQQLYVPVTGRFHDWAAV